MPFPGMDVLVCAHKLRKAERCHVLWSPDRLLRNHQFVLKPALQLRSVFERTRAILCEPVPKRGAPSDRSRPIDLDGLHLLYHARHLQNDVATNVRVQSGPRIHQIFPLHMIHHDKPSRTMQSPIILNVEAAVYLRHWDFGVASSEPHVFGFGRQYIQSRFEGERA